MIQIVLVASLNDTYNATESTDPTTSAEDEGDTAE